MKILYMCGSPYVDMDHRFKQCLVLDTERKEEVCGEQSLRDEGRKGRKSLSLKLLSYSVALSCLFLETSNKLSM